MNSKLLLRKITIIDSNSKLDNEVKKRPSFKLLASLEVKFP